MQYAYPCILNPEEGGGYYVVFPDVRGALTGGKTRTEALYMAQDALTVALAGYVIAGWDIPHPSPVEPGQDLVALEPIPAAKLALYNAMREREMSEADLASQLDLTESAVGELLIPDRYTHITTVMRALRAVGHSLILQDAEPQTQPVA
ncbi:MAG: type II toxin-antitoxin system HicB family antitoxin [Dehalococcoidia bacterium]|nr:type II toxin-antitoxin system HicB family antitoxin [Dehalococcoidia bacterium]